MLNIRYVHVGNDVTCLLTQDGKFIGAVRSSPGYAHPWAFAVDGNDQVVMNARAAEADGEHLDDLYKKCEQALLAEGSALASIARVRPESPARENRSAQSAPPQRVTSGKRTRRVAGSR
jgi:hypothetical protein